MRKREAYTFTAGQKIGFLEITGPAFRENNRTKIPARCVCGIEKVFRADHIRSGLANSCGCKFMEALKAGTRLVHGDKRRGSPAPEFTSWCQMKARCCDENCPAYENYGGRGITICERWMHSYPNFLADMGRKPSSQHSIERKDNGGNYCPENCCWATKTEQANNRRSNRTIEYMGIKASVSEWSRKSKLLPATIIARLNKGWTPGEALTIQPGERR